MVTLTCDVCTIQVVRRRSDHFAVHMRRVKSISPTSRPWQPLGSSFSVETILLCLRCSQRHAAHNLLCPEVRSSRGRSRNMSTFGTGYLKRSWMTSRAEEYSSTYGTS